MKPSLKPLFPFFAAHWKMVAGLTAAGAAISFLDVAFMVRAKHFLDQALWQKEGSLFFQPALLLLTIYLALEGLRNWQDYEGDLLHKRIARRLQDTLVAKIAAAPMRQFVSQRRGDLLQRVMRDASDVSHLPGSLASSSLRDPLRILIFGAVLLKTSPAFAGLAFSCGLAALLLAKRLQRRLTQIYEKIGRLQGSLYQWLETLLQHFPFLKIHNAAPLLKGKWEQTNRELLSLNRRATQAYLGQRLLVQVFLVLLLGILFLSSIRNWGWFPSAPGAVVLMAGSTFFCLAGIRNAVAHWLALAEGSVQARRLSELLQWRAEESAAANQKKLLSPLDEVEIRDLAFGYLPEKTVLRNLNWRLSRGMAVALTGANGSGKTTLSYLLLRLFEPQRGGIYYNRIPAAELDPSSLRRRVGLVFQEPFLLEGSLQENLLFNVEAVSFDKQQEAMSAVGLQALAAAPADLNAFQVGPQGKGLSYGERQRLALARALLADPDLLILDEATSALDPDSEHQILSELLRRRREKITVVISHRLKSAPLPLEKFHLKEGEILRGDS